MICIFNWKGQQQTTFDRQKSFFAQHHVRVDRQMEIAVIIQIEQQFNIFQVSLGVMQVGIQYFNIPYFRKLCAQVQVTNLQYKRNV